MAKKQKKPDESGNATKASEGAKTEGDRDFKALRKEIQRLNSKMEKQDEILAQTLQLLEQLRTEPATIVTLMERVTRDQQTLVILTNLLQSIEKWLGAQAKEAYTYQEQHKMAGLLRDFIVNFLGPQLCYSCLEKVKGGVSHTPLAKHLAAAGLFKAQDDRSEVKQYGNRGRFHDRRRNSRHTQ